MDLKEQAYIAATTHPKYDWMSAKLIADILGQSEKEVRSVLISLVSEGKLIFHPDPQLSDHLFGAPAHAK
jgi:hypothetical protein